MRFERISIINQAYKECAFLLVGVTASLVAPCEESSATLVPDVGRHAVGRDADSSEQVCALLVQVDGDLDRLLGSFLLRLVDVDPLEVDRRHVGANLLSQLDAFVLA